MRNQILESFLSSHFILYPFMVICSIILLYKFPMMSKDSNSIRSFLLDEVLDQDWITKNNFPITKSSIQMRLIR